MMAEKVRRAGFTIDHTNNFSQGHIPLWPDKFASVTATSWIGQVARDRAAVLAIAEKHHRQNEAIRHAKMRREMPQLPEAPVRVSLARQQQKQIDEINRRAAMRAGQIFDKRLTYKVFDYAKDGILGMMSRQEHRSLLRGMDSKQRVEAMKRHSYRIAALETEPEASGMVPSAHTLLKEETLKAMYPAELEELEMATEANNILKETAAVTMRAIEAELVSAGSTVAEPSAPTEATPTWI